MGSTVHSRVSEQAQDTLPCENDQAKPDRFSRLACSTKLSKILEGCPPERCPLDRGPDCDARVSSNLLRLPTCPLNSSHRHFCANLSKLIEVPSPCQAESSSHRGRSNSLAVPRCDPTADAKIRQKIALRKISNSDQLEPLGLAGDFLPGHAMACSLRDSLQGFRVHLRASPDPTNQLPSFPLPSSGQATRPPGGSTAHLQLSKSSTGYSSFATSRSLSRTHLRRSENCNSLENTQPAALWKARDSVESLCGTLWKAACLADSQAPRDNRARSQLPRESSPDPSAHSRNTAWPAPPAAAP